MAQFECFLFGCLGGSLAELLKISKHFQEHSELPKFVSTKTYWILTVAMILAGGTLTLTYSMSNLQLSPLLAVNLGASAPLIIGRFVAQTPPALPGKVD